MQTYDVQEAQKCTGISALINVFDSQILEVDVYGTDTTCKSYTLL
jgi:hypothetical protein